MSSAGLPQESYFLFVPRGPSGFSIRRERVTRGPDGDGAPCRDRTPARALSSEREIDQAAAPLCGAALVDCVDHVVFALPADRPFSQVVPWIIAALRARALSAPQVAFVADGSDPSPDVAECATR
jgi:hypothetical protein